MSARDFEVPVRIADDRVADLIAVGVEQGCDYWARVVAYIDPPGGPPTEETLSAQFGPRWSDRLYRHVHYALIDGAAVVFDVEASERGVPSGRLTLGRVAVSRGLELLAQKPRAFAHLLQEQEDADTGDLFLQLCLLERHVFA